MSGHLLNMEGGCLGKSWLRIAAPVRLRCGLKAYLELTPPLCAYHVTFQDPNIQVCTGHDPANPPSSCGL